MISNQNNVSDFKVLSDDDLNAVSAGTESLAEAIAGIGELARAVLAAQAIGSVNSFIHRFFPV